jgi:hypothetical protein
MYLPSLVALNFDGLNFAVVAFMLDRNERYFRGLPVQFGARLELARLERNILGNVQPCVIARVQSERPVGRRNFQPHFNAGTRYITYCALGVHLGMLARISFGRRGLRAPQRESHKNTCHHRDNQQQPSHKVRAFYYTLFLASISHISVQLETTAAPEGRRRKAVVPPAFVAPASSRPSFVFVIAQQTDIGTPARRKTITF